MFTISSSLEGRWRWDIVYLVILFTSFDTHPTPWISVNFGFLFQLLYKAFWLEVIRQGKIQLRFSSLFVRLWWYPIMYPIPNLIAILTCTYNFNLTSLPLLFLEDGKIFRQICWSHWSDTNRIIRMNGVKEMPHCYLWGDEQKKIN